MSMPTIPDEPFRPSKEQVVIDLLKSIALEETSIAHLLNAEAEKVQALVRKSTHSSMDASEETLCRVSQQVIKLMDVIVMKEWLLLRKLENAMAFHEADDCWELEE
ncbi:hypothetical protein AB4Z21_28395, partial [Paenibacillus sp. MCAF20]